MQDDATRRSAAGKALAALRPSISGTCVVCGTPFETIKAGRRPKMYCSKRCATRAWREKKSQGTGKGANGRREQSTSGRRNGAARAAEGDH